MEDGNTMLTHWTKKIIVEEGHAMQQLFHILQLIIRHYKVRIKLIFLQLIVYYVTYILGVFSCETPTSATLD